MSNLKTNPRPSLVPISTDHPDYISHPELTLLEWSTPSGRYRLVSRAGIYRLEIYDLYRWTSCESCQSGFQALAQRLDEVSRSHSKHKKEEHKQQQHHNTRNPNPNRNQELRIVNIK